MLIARFAEKHQVPTREAIEILDHALMSRRKFLGQAAALGAAATFAPWRKAFGASLKSTADIAIVGAGLAGLSCAYELKKAGVPSTIYEASSRVGGRCWS